MLNVLLRQRHLLHATLLSYFDDVVTQGALITAGDYSGPGDASTRQSTKTSMWRPLEVMPQPARPQPARPQPAKPQPVKAQPVKPQQEKPQSVHAASEQELKETILYHNRGRLIAMNAIQRNRPIIQECQETIDAIRSTASANHGRMSAEDSKVLESEETRKKLWMRLNAEKINDCRRLIGLMDKAEDDLLKLRPTSEEEIRKGFGFKSNELFSRFRAFRGWQLERHLM